MRGDDVVWVNPGVRPADQSAHWHGYIHRGTLYNPDAEAGLIAGLRANTPFWQHPALADLYEPLQTHAVAPDRAWADAFARRIGSAATDAPVAGVPAGRLTVPTGEGVLRGQAFLGRAAAAMGPHVRVIASDATGITRAGEGWVVHTASGDTITADRVIVAAGSGAASLLAGIGLGDVLSVRMSRMLVLTSELLPPAALLAPAREYAGLFLVSRRAPDGRGVWLASDNFSSRSTHEGALVGAWWACSMVERLIGMLGDDLIGDAEVGAYRAVKTHLRTDDVRVPADGLALHPSGSLACLTPPKWSSAPTMALAALAAVSPGAVPGLDELAAALGGGLGGRLGAGRPDPAPMFAETWESTVSQATVAQLRTPGVAALEAAGRLFV